VRTRGVEDYDLTGLANLLGGQSSRVVPFAVAPRTQRASGPKRQNDAEPLIPMVSFSSPDSHIPKSALERLQEESLGNPLSRKTAIERLREELLRSNPPGSAFEQLQRDQRLIPVKSDLQRLHEEMASAQGIRGGEGFGLSLGDAYRQVSALGGWRDQDVIGKAFAEQSSQQLKLWAERISTKPQHYESLIGHVVGPGLAQTLVQQFLQVHAGSSEIQRQLEDIGNKAAAEALTEPTPNGAYRRFIQFLEGLDPLQQLLLKYLLAPLFAALVVAAANPFIDHHVRKRWLSDSLQGQLKQANGIVVSAVGGIALLADFRLVVSKKPLAVRNTPVANAKIVASLEFGTAVRLVRKQGAFSLVEWKGGDGAVVSGWVFSRYLKKFQ
jgi:hypothetical protein